MSSCVRKRLGGACRFVANYAFLLQFIRRQLSRHQFRHFHEDAEFCPSGYGVILEAFHLL